MICYDVETLKDPDETPNGWANPEGMGFGCAVAYETLSDLYHFFQPGQKQTLVDLLEDHGEVLTFNGKRFDNRVLLGNEKGLASPWNDIDLLDLVVRGKFGCQSVAAAQDKVGAKEVHDGTIGLDALCKATLGEHRCKIGHGAHAPKLIKAARWAEVFAYNLQDVRLTFELHEFACRYGYVIDGAGAKIPIHLDW